MSDVTVTVTRSAGVDGAVVVLIDTDFEPGGEDGGPGLRVRVNDNKVYAGKPLKHLDGDAEAECVVLHVDLKDIAYTGRISA